MKSSLETIEKRQQNILALLQKNKQMTTYKLADVLNVSLSTIRRDLNVLETKNDIIRKYGYCIYNDQNQKDFDQSGPELLKQAIARVACSYLSDYDTVFINSSSTALNILHYLKADHLTIVTNNLKIATKPHVSQYNYILTGGELRFPKEVLVGDIAINTITATHADVCVIGCSGISLEHGVTTKIFNEAKINELMIKQTTKVKILVADHRKIGLTSKFKIADITAFDCLITDKHCSSTLITELRKTGLKVIQVD